MKTYRNYLSVAKDAASRGRRIERFIKSEQFMLYLAICRDHEDGEALSSKALDLLRALDFDKLRQHVYIVTRDLSLCGTAQLRHLCAENGIKYYANMSKDEMVNALEKTACLDTIKLELR